MFKRGLGEKVSRDFCLYRKHCSIPSIFFSNSPIFRSRLDHPRKLQLGRCIRPQIASTGELLIKTPPSIRNAYPISADFGGKNKERLFFQILEVSKNKERLFEKPAAGENFWGFEARKM